MYSYNYYKYGGVAFYISNNIHIDI